MTEEERIFQGLLFRPGAQELREIKLRTAQSVPALQSDL